MWKAAITTRQLLPAGLTNNDLKFADKIITLASSICLELVNYEKLLLFISFCLHAKMIALPLFSGNILFFDKNCFLIEHCDLLSSLCLFHLFFLQVS